jgi:hypothetical protein
MCINVRPKVWLSGRAYYCDLMHPLAGRSEVTIIQHREADDKAESLYKHRSLRRCAQAYTGNACSNHFRCNTYLRKICECRV